MRDFNGLKLLGDYAVWCHYKVEHDPMIKRYRHVLDTPVIALPEETGIAASIAVHIRASHDVLSENDGACASAVNDAAAFGIAL
ncbi:hypothetical protein B4123_2723 [Bacillus paralicheniformis]|nr:hypothetical protein B4123_2723 [Bacillus paralicheniformis]